MKRRQFLLAGGAATMGGLGALTYNYAPPLPVANPRKAHEVTRELYNSFSQKAMDQFTAAYDSPFRQYHNRGVWTGGTPIALGDLSRSQLRLVSELMYSGLSEHGRQIVPNQFFLQLPDIMINNLQILGDPNTDLYQVMISGPHLNLRIGGANSEGVAFGGPQVYGDQRGNEEVAIPGNIYTPTLNAGMAIFHSMSEAEQADAVLTTSPIQTQIELQGSHGIFAGIEVGALSPQSKTLIRKAIDITMSPYAASDVAYANECLEANGGVDALHLSFYEDSRYEGSEVYQTYRLEGPAAVFYFRGFPHVHAFFNVAMDGDSPLSTGQFVADNPSRIEGDALHELLERVMVEAVGVDLAWYNPEGVVGLIQPGTVREGDLYNAESWQSTIKVIEIRGDKIAGRLKQRLDERQYALQPDRLYTVATVNFVADNLLAEDIGDGTIIRESGLLRDQLIAHVRENGFS